MRPRSQCHLTPSRASCQAVFTIGNTLDAKDNEIAVLTLKQHNLEAEIASSRKTKRSAVQKDPNRLFYDHLMIEEAKERAGIDTQIDSYPAAPQPPLMGWEAAEVSSLWTTQLDERLQTDLN